MRAIKNDNTGLIIHYNELDVTKINTIEDIKLVLESLHLGFSNNTIEEIPGLKRLIKDNDLID